VKTLFSVAGLLALSAATLFAAETIPVVPTDNGTPPATALPVEVVPTNPNLYFMGRFDLNDPASPTCAWPGSAIGIHFHGTAINAELTLGNNRFEVVIDDTPVKVLTGSKEKTLYNLASGLADGDHTALVFKDTESVIGEASLQGFQLSDGGTVLPFPPFAHRIEIIGDSISCGYGNEAASQNEKFSPTTENNYWAYGAVAARAFNADYTCIAWSGKKLWPDNTIVSLYDFTLPLKPDSIWKFDGPKPDAVLINLCTNDFGKDEPEQEGWVKAYHDFLAQIRKNYPDSTIYLAIGSMMSGQRQIDARNYIQRVVKESNDAGDAKIHFIEFPTQNPANGIGANWHPSVKTDQQMAQIFIDALKKDMNWTPVSAQ
jgi:lysophospholipase L1-like esterase